MSETGYLEVKNFEQFQHYKKRNPPWIKLHSALLDDYDFARLPDAAKMHLMGIWILASKTGNKIPADSDWIAKRIGATTPVDIEALVATGFVRRLRRASDVLAPDKQVPPLSRVEERREEESTKATPSGGAREVTHSGEVSRAELLGRLRKVCAPRNGKVAEADMRTNADIVDWLAKVYSYEEIARAAAGRRARIERGEIPSMPAGCGWTLKVYRDKDTVRNQMDQDLGAYQAMPPPTPEKDAKRGGAATGIGDVLDFTKFAKGA